MGVVYQILGGLLIFAGLSVVWTPIPVGIILIAFGLALILANSETARDWVTKRRASNQKFDSFLFRAEAFLPGPMRRVLERTRPVQPDI